MDIENGRAYQLLSEGDCGEALEYASEDPNKRDPPSEFKPEMFRRLYIAGAYACLDRTPEAEEAFRHAEELDWPSSTGTIAALIRGGCLYNAIVEYLQINRPAKSCELTQESTTTESTR